jgi:hypothetical protein
MHSIPLSGRRAGGVEAHEPSDVGLVPEAWVVGEALPQHAGAAIVAAELALERGVAEPARGLELLRCDAVLPLRRGRARPIERCARRTLRVRPVAEEELDRRDGPGDAERLVRGAERAQTGAELVVDDPERLEHRPELVQRLRIATGLELARPSPKPLADVDRPAAHPAPRR